MGETERRRLIQVGLAFLAVYIVWGSTYLAIRVVLETLPPFLTAGVRFTAAGAVLYAIMRLRGVEGPRREHWPDAFRIGALLLLFGNGAVMWAEQRIPSGIAALLVAIEPMWIVLLDWLRPGGVRPRPATGVGVALGFAGLVILVGPSNLSGGGPVDLAGAGAVVFGAFTWAAGSLYSRDARLPASPFMASAVNMFAGGVLLLIAGVAAGEPWRYHLADVSARSVAGVAYLAVFGSLVAFTAYNWLLGQVSASKVSTYAYVNPVVAVLLGWGLAGEALSSRVGLAGITIVAAVALITTASARRKVHAEPALPPSPAPPRSELRRECDPLPSEG
jgi:drug/metabolite transporter (DMT)-like permease